MLMLMPFLAAAVTAAPPGHQKAPPRPPCPTIEIRQADARHAPRRPVFSARRVGDLEFVLSYARPLAGHRLELQLLTPSGHLYQTLSLTLPPLRRRDPQGRATLRLPVSGTLVERSSLFGTWSLQPLLDGSPLPCRHTQRFTLTR